MRYHGSMDDTKTCESRSERTGESCPARAQWKVQAGTRMVDAQLSCGRHLHQACQAMAAAELPRRVVLSVTGV